MIVISFIQLSNYLLVYKESTVGASADTGSRIPWNSSIDFIFQLVSSRRCALGAYPTGGRGWELSCDSVTFCFVVSIEHVWVIPDTLQHLNCLDQEVSSIICEMFHIFSQRLLTSSVQLCSFFGPVACWGFAMNERDGLLKDVESSVELRDTGSDCCTETHVAHEKQTAVMTDSACLIAFYPPATQLLLSTGLLIFACHCNGQGTQ